MAKIEIWNVDPHLLHAYQRWIATEDGVIYAHSSALATYIDLLHAYQRWIATEDGVIYAHSSALATYIDNIDGELIGMTVSQLRKLGYTVELDHTC